MKSNLLHGAEQFYQSWRRKQLWHRIVSGLACVVVFCTVYALILPAITLENEPVCGLEEHTHTDECYTVELQYPQSTMDCVLESGAPVIHTHDEFCYSEDGTLICRLPELEAHSHTSRCYREDRTLICTEEEDLGHAHSAVCYARHRGELICAEEEDKGHTHGKSCYETDRELTCADESEDHVHDDGCYAETERLVCTEEERPGHTHSDSCYAWTEELTCTEEERPAGHIHTDACYEVTTRLACGKEEVIPHTHGEDCYDESGALVCDMEEVLEHQHTEACIVPPEGEPWEVRVLTCGLEEHTHSDKCYPAEEAETPPAGEEPAAEPEEQYLCGLEEHTHTEDCRDAEGNLTCTLAEHIHDESCLAAEAEAFALTAQTESGVEVTVSGSLEYLPCEPEKITLTVEEIVSEAAESIRDQALEEAGLTAEKNYLFDVSLWFEDELVEPSGPVTLVFSGLPFEGNAPAKVYHIDEETEQATDMDAVRKEDDVVLDTDHFSTYSVSLLAEASGEYTMTAAHAEMETMYADADASKYLLLAHEGGKYYALGGDGQTYNVTILDSGNVQYSGTAEQLENLCWTMSEKETDSNNVAHRIMYIRNAKTGSYLYPNGSSLLTGAKTKVNLWFQDGNSYAATIYPTEDWPKIAFGDSHQFHTYTEGENEAWFYVAKVDSLPYCHVWLDGTDGGLMSLGGAGDTCRMLDIGETFTLPNTFDAPVKYAYRLSGWYDVNASKYYAPGAVVPITQDTVFYADWTPATYDVGEKNGNTVQSLNTNAFITTRVFDYGALFNVQSSDAQTDINSAEHMETWSLVQNSAYNGSSLGFVFRDWDTYFKNISYPVGSETWSGEVKVANPNDNNPDIYSGLDNSNLIDILFNPSRTVIGKTYVGTGNYLYQYDDETGYYYYDSKLNAASYNQSASRFYIYNYLERTSDSPKDSATAKRGRDSDFLPFNSPYVNTNGKNAQTYTAENGKSGYQYDAKYDSTEGGVTCSPNNAGTNYWFGMSSSIRFYLPDDSGPSGANQSTKHTDMIFKFSGDDDVWVLVDGQLILDIGGLHGIEEGTINFSTGEVWRSTGEGDGETIQKSFSAGEHYLTVYYLERGGSQSNCAIYFNIAPRDYSLELTKTDRDNPTKVLPGAEFTVYENQDCTVPVKTLRDASGNTVSNGVFVTDGTGQLYCYGLQPGITYYIKETKAPPGYNGNENVVIRLSIAGIEGNYAITSELYVDGQLVAVNGNGNIYLTEDQSATGEERMLKYKFSNQVGYMLPETGGAGTAMYTLGGLCLMAGALLLYSLHNRRKGGRDSPC